MSDRRNSIAQANLSRRSSLAAKQRRTTTKGPTKAELESLRSEERIWSFWSDLQSIPSWLKQAQFSSGLSFFTLPTALSTFHAVILSAS
jgi:hypothetical protein